MRHVPNILTLLRLLSVPMIIWLLSTERTLPAFWLFIAAGATDAVDGTIARLFDARSRLGQWLDPLADKVMLVSVYVVLGLQGYVPLWLTVLVVLRDVLIVVYALLYALSGWFGGTPILISKINTAVQIVLAGLVLGRLGGQWDAALMIQAFIYAAAATTSASGAAYLLAANRRPPVSGGNWGDTGE